MSAVKEDPEVLDEYGSSVNEESTEENETENADDERTEDDTQDPDDPVCKHVLVHRLVTFGSGAGTGSDQSASAGHGRRG